MLIENQVIEMLEAGVAIEDIAKHLDITIDEVKDIEDYACENRDCDDDNDGQPTWEQEWEDFGEVYSDERDDLCDYSGDEY